MALAGHITANTFGELQAQIWAIRLIPQQQPYKVGPYQ